MTTLKLLEIGAIIYNWYEGMGGKDSERISRRGLFFRIGAGALWLPVAEYGVYAVIEYVKRHMPEWFEDAKIGRRLLAAALEYPEELPAGIALWNATEGFRDSPVFRRPLSYRQGSENRVVGMGDSNMVGAGGSDRSKSFVELYRQKVIRTGVVSDWGDSAENLASRGATSGDVLQKQYPQIKDKVTDTEQFDIFASMGGDDPFTQVTSLDEIQSLLRLSQSPFDHPDLYLHFATRIIATRNQVQANIVQLIARLNSDYGGRLRHFGLLTVPMVRDSQKIVLPRYTPSDFREIPLSDKHAKRIAGNAANVINTAIVTALEKAAHVRFDVVGIDTYKEPVGGDQHLPEESINDLVNSLTVQFV